MNKKVIYFALFTVFSILAVTAALTNQFKQKNDWEAANNIKVSIGSFSGDLAEAISSHKNELKSLSLTQEATVTKSRGHRFDEVYVSVNGVGMTLRKAIQTTDLCGTVNSTINYTNAPDPSHLGTEVEVAPGESLQDAINDGTLVGIDGGWRNATIDPVNGTITMVCDSPEPFCAGAGCPGDTNNDGIEIIPYEINLTWGQHTNIDCINAGGEVYITPSTYKSPSCPPGYSCPLNVVLVPGKTICKFPRAACPVDSSGKPNWQPYGLPTITETQSHTCSYPFALCRYDCTTGSHPFSETNIETCIYYGGGYTCHWNGCRCRTPSELTPTVCSAPIRAIGCY